MLSYVLSELAQHVPNYDTMSIDEKKQVDLDLTRAINVLEYRSKEAYTELFYELMQLDRLHKQHLINRIIKQYRRLA